MQGVVPSLELPRPEGEYSRNKITQYTLPDRARPVLQSYGFWRCSTTAAS